MFININIVILLERSFNMRIIESKLRRIIRQVIRENVEEYSESEQEYIDMGLFDEEGEFYCDPPPPGRSTMTIYVTDPVAFSEDPRAGLYGNPQSSELGSIYDFGKHNIDPEIANRYDGTNYVPNVVGPRRR